MEKLHPIEQVSLPPFTLGFLASYNGSSMQAIVEAIDSDQLSGMAPGVIISENNSTALQFAKNKNIPSFWVHESTEHERDAQILDILLNHNITLLICSGYMKKVPPSIISKIPTLNIHPADTHKFGGKGMYGDRVHERVLQAGESVTLPTVHIVTENYDEGPILSQGEVTVYPSDEVDDLRERVKQAESKLYIEVLQQISTGTLTLPF